MKRRIFSIITALALCLTLLPVTALAATYHVGIETIKAVPTYPGVWNYDSETNTLTIDGDIAFSGSFDGTVINNGTLIPPNTTEGPKPFTFTGDVINNGTITGGIFDGNVTNNGKINGGTFNGPVVNYGTVKDGIIDFVASVTVDDATTYYNDINTAWTAAQGKIATVKLLQSVDLGSSYLSVSNAQSDITLEMSDDVTLTSTANSSYGTIHVTTGSFTLASGTIQNTCIMGKGINVTGGSATISGGTIKSTGTSSSGVYVQGSGSITITDSADITGKGYGVRVNSVNATTTISSGKIQSTAGAGVNVVNSNTKVAISGGTITGKTYGLNGFATLSGGTFSGESGAVSYNSGTVGALLAKDYGYYDSGDALITDTSGTTLTGTVTVKRVKNTFTVTFDATGGNVSPSSVETDADGKLVSSLPTPTRTGYDFDGWYTAATGGEKITTDTVFADNTTIYAHWRDSVAPVAPTHAQLTDTSSDGSPIAPIIRCATANSDHTETEYLLKAGSYSLGTVTWDETAQKWYCDVTVSAELYITDYVKVKGAHILASDQPESQTVRFWYTAGNTNPWNVSGGYDDASRKPVFLVTDAVASVTTGGSTTFYADIASAFAAASGKTATITLLADKITVNASLLINNEDSKITLELNGKTLQNYGNTAVSGGIIAISAGELIIQDSSADSSGLIYATNGDSIYTTNGSSLTVESGTVRASSYAIRSQSGATVTVRGGKVTSGTAIYGHNGSIVVNGGTVMSQGANGIYATFGSTVTVTGGFINGTTANFYLYNSTASVSGGWFKHQVSEEHCADGYAPTTTAQTVDGSPVESAEWYTVTKCTYTVSFNSQGGSAVDSQTVDYGNTTAKPSDPTRDGYAFGGWYTDVDCTTEYNFDAPVTGNLTLYAKWTRNTYTVTFDSRGGSAVDSQTVDHGNTAAKPSDPTREGYTFGGWYTDADCTTEYNFDAPVTGNLTLYAKWTRNTYTVTFDSRGGSAVDSQTVDHGNAAVKPSDPIRVGYTFGGWYTDAACTTAYDFAAPVTGNLTLYAKWTADYIPPYIPPVAPIKPSTPTYPPTVEQPDEGGSVAVTPQEPKKGDKVTITPKPDEDHEVSGVVVTDQNGKEIPVTDNGDGTWSFTQPGGKVTIQVTFAEINTACDGGKDCPSRAYSDLDVTKWYHEAADYVISHGLMTGDDGKFSPNGILTRAEMAQILYNAEGRPAVSGHSAFTDVSDSAWYADAVLWASASGVVEGCGNGTFAPNAPLTREQLAVMLYRFAQSRGGGFTGLWAFQLDYSDAGKVSDWAYEAMCWCVKSGVIEGADGSLKPQGAASRAEAAQMLQRFMENLAK